MISARMRSATVLWIIRNPDPIQERGFFTNMHYSGAAFGRGEKMTHPAREGPRIRSVDMMSLHDRC